MTLERVGWTIGALALAILLRHTPLPGLDHGGLDLPEDWYSTNMSVGALGLISLIEAFALTELLALVVPRWRRHRLSPAGQRLLRHRAWLLTGVLTLLQSYKVTLLLVEQKTLWHDTSLVNSSFWLPMLALLLGALAIYLLAFAIETKGTRHGVLTMFVALGLSEWLIPLTLGLDTQLVSSPIPIRGARVWSSVGFLLMLFVAVSTWLLARHAQTKHEHGSLDEAPNPLCGALPIAAGPGWSSTIAGLPLFGLSWATLVGWFSLLGVATSTQLDGIGQLLERREVQVVLSVVISLGLARFLGQQLSSRRATATLVQRLGLFGPKDERARTVGAARPWVVTLSFVAVGLTADVSLGYVHIGLPSAFFVVVLIALVFELRQSYSADATLTQSVWFEQRVYAVPLIRERLRQAGIEHHVEGAILRTFVPFFAFFQPIKFYTRKVDAVQAHRLLTEALLPDKEERPDSAPSLVAPEVTAPSLRLSLRPLWVLWVLVTGLALFSGAALYSFLGRSSKSTVSLEERRAVLQVLTVDDHANTFPSASPEKALPQGVTLRPEPLRRRSGQGRRIAHYAHFQFEDLSEPAARERAHAWLQEQARPDATRFLLERLKSDESAEARSVELRAYLVKEQPIFTSLDVASPVAVDEGQSTAVRLGLTSAAAESFRQYTASHIGTRIALVVDGAPVSVPVIQSEITGPLSLLVSEEPPTDESRAEAMTLAERIAGLR